MKTEHLTPLSVLIGSLLISAAIYFRPASTPASFDSSSVGYQAVFADGAIYVFDAQSGQLQKIIPTK